MWFTETPWPPILICSVGAVLFVVAWHAQRRTIHLGGVAAMAALGFAIYFLEQSIVTEREKVEASIYDLVAAASALDIEKTLTFISSTRTDIQLSARIGLALFEAIENMRVTDVQITLKMNNSRATTHLRANADFTFRSSGEAIHYPTRWKLTWQREGNDWKVIKAQQLAVITGEPIPTWSRRGQR